MATLGVIMLKGCMPGCMDTRTHGRTTQNICLRCIYHWKRHKKNFSTYKNLVHNISTENLWVLIDGIQYHASLYYTWQISASSIPTNIQCGMHEKTTFNYTMEITVSLKPNTNRLLFKNLWVFFKFFSDIHINNMNTQWI